MTLTQLVVDCIIHVLVLVLVLFLYCQQRVWLRRGRLTRAGYEVSSQSGGGGKVAQDCRVRCVVAVAVGELSSACNCVALFYRLFVDTFVVGRRLVAWGLD